MLIPVSPTIRDAAANAVVKLALDRHDLTVVKPKATLEGVGPGKDSSQYRFGFRSTGVAQISGAGKHATQCFAIKAGRTIYLTYEVDFELLDGGRAISAFEGRFAIRY